MQPKDTLSTEALNFEGRLNSLAEQLEAIGMDFTLISVRKLLGEMKGAPLTVELLKSRTQDIQVRLNDELERTKFFCVETHPGYIDPIVPLFGVDVGVKFASATFDIEEAGRCLALGLTTAAVFHSMRVLEIGIKATSKCLSIPETLKASDRNWGVMLKNIRDEVKRRNALKSSGWQIIPSDSDFFDEIHASLDAVRNVWRNATMHVEKKYTPEEANHIFGAVRGFMRKLASRVDEDGKPNA